MRMEELENSRYEKSTDTVERYLLNIIQQYFKDQNIAADSSKEYIIQEAVARLKSEMDYNNLGVMSVTIPSGEVKKGHVTITLEDLEGEPAITDKHTAFNVDFGKTTGTACEGNDPRLSDPRTPLSHTHSVEDILGLEGIINSLGTQFDKVDTFNHSHTNKDLLDKLIYTGKKNVIDLTIIDELDEKVNNTIEEIKQLTLEEIQNCETSIEDINETLREVNAELDNIKRYVENKKDDLIEDIKSYAEQILLEYKTDIINTINSDYVKKSDIRHVIDIAKNVMTYINEQRVPLRTVVSAAEANNGIYEIALGQNILDELARRQINSSNFHDISFKYSIQYTKNNTTYSQPLPFFTRTPSQGFTGLIEGFNEQRTISGYIAGASTGIKAIQINVKALRSNITDAMLSGDLVIEVYSKDICNIYS